jgi:glutaredoxin
VDSQGNVHYSDQPPPPTAKGVEEKQIQGGASSDAALPYATREAAKNFPVTLYNTNCGEPCTQAREYLLKRGIPFEEKDASTTPVQEELRKLAGALQVPVLAIGRMEPLKGFGAEQWGAALDAAGYPRTGRVLPSGPRAPAESESPRP